MRTHRELYDEAAAVAVVALDEDTAAVRLDDVLDDREPESGRTGRIAIGAVLREALEDVVANFRRDTRGRVSATSSCAKSLPDGPAATWMVPPSGV